MANQVVVEFMGNARGLNTVIGRLDGRLGAFGQLATRITQGVGLAVAATATQSIRSFVSFDEAMTNSMAIMGDLTEAQRSQLQSTAIDIGRTTRLSATEAAEALFFLASAGLDVEESLAALPEVAAFAQAGNFDMAKATDLLTDAQSALGLTTDDAAQNLENMILVGDTFVAMNQSANASVEQFSEAMTNGGASALRRFNVPLAQGGALLNVWADNGIKSDQAGTALRRTLIDLSSKSRENAEEFAALGISVFDSSGAMRNIASIVADMEGAFGGLSIEQKEAELAMLGFTEESSKAIAPLIGNSEALREYEEAIGDVAGATDEVAALQLNSLAAQWDLLKGSIEAVSLTATGELKPGLQDAIESVRDFVDLHGPAIAEGLTSAIGSAVTFVSEKGPGLFEGISEGVSVLRESSGTVWDEFNAAWDVTGGPILDEIVVQAGEAGEAFANWFVNEEGVGTLEDFRSKLDELSDWWAEEGVDTQGLADDLGESIGIINESLQSIWDDHGDAWGARVERLLTQAGEDLNGVVAWIEENDVTQTVTEAITTGVEDNVNTWEFLFGDFIDGIQLEGPNIQETLSEMGRGIGEAFSMAMADPMITNTTDAIGEWIHLMGGLTDWESEQNQRRRDSLNRLWEWSKGDFDRFLRDLRAGWGKFTSWFTEPIGDIWEGTARGFGELIRRIQEAWNSLSFSIEVPEFLGGGSAQAKTSSRGNIPKYAQGTVAMPNDPHLALFGDNKVEREIVSPESLMRSIVRAELDASGPGNQDGGLTLMIDTLNQNASVEELADAIVQRASLGGAF